MIPKQDNIYQVLKLEVIFMKKNMRKRLRKKLKKDYKKLEISILYLLV